MRGARALLARMAVGCVLVGAWSADARADGMPFPETTAASLEVKATAQRAVVWLRETTWEVHIQPIFNREQGRAAWVVPFPVRPEIEESSARLFDELEIITSPVFIRFCVPEYDSGCGADDAAGGLEGDKRGASGEVEVWERGQVGQLDYTVLSATGGDNLVDWLGANDYAVSAAAATAIKSFETEGQFFFVATVSEGADPAKPIDPVRFRLPGASAGFYPLRLTALAVPQGATLDLTLWVIFPHDQAFEPTSHPHQLFEGNPDSRQAYDLAVDNFFAAHSADTLLLLSSMSSTYDSLFAHERCNYDMGPYVCVSYDELGITVPASWCDDLKQMKQQGVWIQRYQGRLDAAAMANDLVLETAPAGITQKNCFYLTSEGQCSEDDGCSVARGLRRSSWLALAMAVFLLVALLRRRRRSA